MPLFFRWPLVVSLMSNSSTLGCWTPAAAPAFLPARAEQRHHSTRQEWTTRQEWNAAGGERGGGEEGRGTRSKQTCPGASTGIQYMHEHVCTAERAGRKGSHVDYACLSGKLVRSTVLG